MYDTLLSLFVYVCLLYFWIYDRRNYYFFFLILESVVHKYCSYLFNLAVLVGNLTLELCLQVCF